MEKVSINKIELTSGDTGNVQREKIKSMTMNLNLAKKILSIEFELDQTEEIADAMQEESPG